MSVPPYPAPPAPKSPMGPHKKAGLVSGGLFAGLVVIGLAMGGGGGTPVTAPVAAGATNTESTGAPDQASIDKLQTCIDMTAGNRAYDPALWDTELCGEYKGSLGSAGQPTTAPAAAPTTEAAAEPTAEPTKKLTVAQENAVEKAASYLEYSGFSRTGLIKQLKFEGFSTKDATFGVDAQKANWNEQAVRKAEDYLEYSSFSRSGLITQLKFEGFTTKQAEYGVKKAGL
ncbi:Ltp family lipoprotein [Actinoplanes sp. NPDC023801]|uniref:Ltp family lipoprotein n=1 Tax=Actinoplanes sp. NPDC023801 TaxID=3154595 RepID=UPI0033F6338E